MIPARLRNMPGIGVDQVGDEADAAANPEILRLENLDTDLRPPRVALTATRRAIEEDAANSYLPFRGGEALRQEAAARVSRQSGHDYDWRDSCLVTAGGLNGILDALLALVDTDDIVLLADPIYAGLLNRVRLAGGIPRLVPYQPAPEGWRLDLDALGAAGNSRLRAVLMVNPSMPSGAVLNPKEWECVAQLCRQTGAWLIYDAALERILYDDAKSFHPASLPGMVERTITVGSASKEFRMIGWRVGWVVGPPEVVQAISLVHMSNTVTPVGIAQSAAAAVLAADHADDDAGVNAAVVEWQRRRDLMLHEMEGMPVLRPAGGWCMLLDVSQLGFDSRTASRRLIESAKIAATPMVHWGSERSDRYVRFVFSNEPCERLRGMGARVRSALGKPQAP
jgi:aspartate/methionine/tyrosine aminotransferase